MYIGNWQIAQGMKQIQRLLDLSINSNKEQWYLMLFDIAV